MSRFKPGDRVVRNYQGMWDIGTPATIISEPSGTAPRDYIVIIDGDSEETAWFEHYIELEDVFNSPLYRALK